MATVAPLLGTESAAGDLRPSPGSAAQPQRSSTLIQQEVADASEVPDGERKTVTALFADIKGSMELIEDLDPEEARRLVDPALKLMMDAVHRYEGYVAQSTGDGIFALFGAPVAHEDHPQRALHAARRMQEDLKRYADRLREQGQPSVIGSGGSQQRRSCGPIDRDRRCAYRIHTDRAFDQLGLASADSRDAGLGGDRGGGSKIGRRLLPAQAARRQQDQRRQRASRSVSRSPASARCGRGCNARQDAG